MTLSASASLQDHETHKSLSQVFNFESMAVRFGSSSLSEGYGDFLGSRHRRCVLEIGIAAATGERLTRWASQKIRGRQLFSAVGRFPTEILETDKARS